MMKHARMAASEVGRQRHRVSSGGATWPWVVVAICALTAILARGYVATLGDQPGGVRDAALEWIKLLGDKQRAAAVLPYDSPQRVDWHFIPKPTRKGVQIRDMTAAQREAALKLLRACLSEIGYQKATQIMELESVLHELEKSRPGAPLRDPERYFFTVFGEPAAAARWGLSIEGHHLSLNFVFDGDRVISSTPSVFAANPAIMKSAVSGVPQGRRVLEKEETLAFELLHSLTEQQRGQAVLSAEPLREVRAAGQPQPPQEPPQGLPVAQMNAAQRKLLQTLVQTYAEAMPAHVAAARMEAIEQAGWERVFFAWSGADKPGVGHYYRIQGPTFLIEFVNTQPDAAGNPANHIHSVWRDMRGDFALPLKS